MTILDNFFIGSNPCVYLPDQVSRLEYQIVFEMTGGEFEELMNHGWRKFGPMLFHPVCSVCRQCRPLRLPVKDFQPNRSQKRAWQKHSQMTVVIDRPRVDKSRIDLFNLYHSAQEMRKGWECASTSEEEYSLHFVTNPVAALEIAVYDEGVLRGIMLVDLTPTVVSAVYHFYHPEFSRHGLGTFLILKTIELARQRALPFVYLGYFVAKSSSMLYKSHFRPFELLGTDWIWRPGMGSEATPEQEISENGGNGSQVSVQE